MKIFILTYCRKPELLYGTTLIFKTLRVGFPTADVTVVDNASVPQVRDTIRNEAIKCGCTFRQNGMGISHHNFIRNTIMVNQGTVVFVDPDIVFWEKCEHWNFDTLVAGRLIPKFRDEYTGCITMPRLHTSFLWIPSAGRFASTVDSFRVKYFDFDPVTPYMFNDGGLWYRFDTGASLYSVMKDKMTCFSENELNSYDHLFCGSHIDLVAPKIPKEDRDDFHLSHSYAANNYQELKGIWKKQEDYFRVRAEV